MNLVLLLIAAHLAAGLLFGAAFLIRGLPTLDHNARGSSRAFRALILPGVAALWPLLWLKWRRAQAGQSPPTTPPATTTPGAGP